MRDSDDIIDIYGMQEKAMEFCDKLQDVICVTDESGDNSPVVYQFAKLLHSCITDKDEWKSVIEDDDFDKNTLANTNKNSTDEEKFQFLRWKLKKLRKVMTGIAFQNQQELLLRTHTASAQGQGPLQK